MLILRLTQKLARRLRVELPPQAEPAPNLCADWCCHTFTFSRYRYLLVTNPTTFYSVVLLAKGAGNPPDFIKVVSSGLGNYLTGAGHGATFEQQIVPELSTVAFSPVGNRQVTGVMNDFIQMAPFFLADLSPMETSDRLNAVPLGPLGLRSAKKVFPPAGRFDPEFRS